MVFKNVFHLIHLTCVTSVALLLQKIKKNLLDKKREQGRCLLFLFCRRPYMSSRSFFSFCGGAQLMKSQTGS